MCQAILVVLIVFYVQALAACIPLAAGVGLVPANLNNLIVLDPNLEPA